MTEFFRQSARMKFAEFVLAGAGLVSAACVGGVHTDTKPKNTDNQPKAVITREVPPLNPNGFLDLPFPKNEQMKVVQGWIYAGTSDFNNDGKPDTDYTVRVKHDNSYETRNLHMNPASIQEKKIPQCGNGYKMVVRGEIIGTAGDTGTPVGWIHDHFEVRDPNGNLVDPYDIRGTTKDYPDPNFSNGKFCGPKTLWRNCPIDPNLVRREEATPYPTVTPIAPVPTVDAKSPTLVPAPKETYPKGTGGLRVEMVYADGTAAFGIRTTLTKQTLDSAGKPALGDFVENANFNNGFVNFVSKPGKYVLIMPNFAGPRFNRGVEWPGIADIEIREGETNVVRVNLGGITINLKDGKGNPTVGRLFLMDEELKILEIDESNPLGAVKADFIGGTYIVDYYVGPTYYRIGPVSVAPGQAVTFDCRATSTNFGVLGKADCARE